MRNNLYCFGREVPALRIVDGKVQRFSWAYSKGPPDLTYSEIPGLVKDITRSARINDWLRFCWTSVWSRGDLHWARLPFVLRERLGSSGRTPSHGGH